MILNGTDIYAGTDDGLYISKNNGELWTKAKFPVNPVKEDNHPEVEITSISANGKNIFVGSTEGVYYSNNAGLTWMYATKGIQQSPFVPRPDGVKSVAVNSTTAFAGFSEQTDTKQYLIPNSGGIFISSDNGRNWRRSCEGLEEFDVEELAISGNNVLASTNHNTYISTNSGISWTKTKQVLSSFATSGATVYANAKEVYFSKDNGITWVLANTGLPKDKAVYTISNNGSIAITVVQEVGVYLTSNNGKLWTPISGDLKFLNVYAIVITATDVLVATNNGIWKRPLANLIKK